MIVTDFVLSSKSKINSDIHDHLLYTGVGGIPCVFYVNVPWNTEDNVNGTPGDTGYRKTCLESFSYTLNNGKCLSLLQEKHPQIHQLQCLDILKMTLEQCRAKVFFVVINSIE
jgi:hypothetical protein